MDPVSPDATGNILTVLKNSGYNVPSNLSEEGALSTIGKSNANAALGNVIIRALDEDGNDLEEWQLNNPFIVGITMNDYNYEGEDLVTIDVEFRYDWASYIIPARPDGLSAGEGVAPGGRLFTLGGPS